MNVVPVNNMLLVEIYDKGNKRRSHGSDPFISVIASANLGIVKHSSNEAYPIGTRIYFGGQYEKLLVEGTEVLSMKEDNVVAKLVE